MSFTEVTEQVPLFSRKERLALSHLLLDLELKDDEQHKADLDRRMAAMDAGQKYTQEDVLRLHLDLIAQGR